jgi:hypothetical protein
VNTGYLEVYKLTLYSTLIMARNAAKEKLHVVVDTNRVLNLSNNRLQFLLTQCRVKDLEKTQCSINLVKSILDSHVHIVAQLTAHLASLNREMSLQREAEGKYGRNKAYTSRRYLESTIVVPEVPGNVAQQIWAGPLDVAEPARGLEATFMHLEEEGRPCFRKSIDAVLDCMVADGIEEAHDAISLEDVNVTNYHDDQFPILVIDEEDSIVGV